MFEMRRILVPTDFSRHAEDALRYAVWLGERHEAEVTVLHVDEFSVAPFGALGPRGEAIAAYEREKLRFIRAQFNLLRKKVQGAPIRLKTHLAQGRAYKVIVEESERRKCDLLVIATRGLTPLSARVIGSTAERVVRLSRQPVLSLQSAPEDPGKIRSILCPTDLSPAGNVALTYALSIARQNKAVLYVQYVSVLENPESEAEIRKRLPVLHDFHPLADEVRVHYIFDRDVDPGNSILRFADDREVDLIVMSAHGRNGLRRVYVGNITAEVVQQSSSPVLTVTHPFHKQVFTQPVTERLTGPLVTPQEPRRKRA
jgi:nucleotide-binding universal stress UspA family protein